MTLAHFNRTSIIVVLHTWSQGPIAFPLGSSVDGPGPLMRVLVNKNISGAPGTTQMVLKPKVATGPLRGAAVADLVEEGDWFEVLALKNNKLVQLMVGRIDAVNLQTAVGQQGAAETLVSVAGRDFSFALTDTPLYFNPWDEAWDNFRGNLMFQIIGEGLSGSPNDLIKAIITGIFSNGRALGGALRIPTSVQQQLVIPALQGNPAATPLGNDDGFQATNKWFDFLDLRKAFQSRLRGEVITTNALTQNAASSILDFIRAWMNPVMNEFWMDTNALAEDRRGYVFFREKPFVNATEGLESPWYRLVRHFVDRRELTSVNLTRGLNRINHIWLVGELLANLGQDVYSLYSPIYNLQSMERYGLRRLEESTSYLTPEGLNPVEEAKTWLQLIRDWNVLNHRFYSGTIALGEMRPEIRPGQKLSIFNGPIGPGFPADAGRADLLNHFTFYVEGVQHMFTDGLNPVGSTIIQVSRGFPEAERVSALGDELRNWTTPQGILGPPTSANQRTRLDAVNEARIQQIIDTRREDG